MQRDILKTDELFSLLFLSRRREELKREEPFSLEEGFSLHSPLHRRALL